LIVLARVFFLERKKPYRALSERGKFVHNFAEPLFNWWGENERVLLTQCRSSVQIEEPGGGSSTVVNGASHNYAGFYKPTAESEELQRLCLDMLPLADARSVPVLAKATHQAIATFFSASFCFTTSTGYGSNYVALPAIMRTTSAVILDDKCHNSMFTGTFRGQAACMRKFKHNDLQDLELILRELCEAHEQVIVGIEGLCR
jgi:serine palmitoyltransferase